MNIISEYIQQAYLNALGYTPDYDDFVWQLDSTRPYVNSYILFEKGSLTEVMEHMITLAVTDATQCARSKKILQCWILATDWQAQRTRSEAYVPRVHPNSSGRTDQLLRADTLPLFELDEEMFKEATGQQDTQPGDYITPAQLHQSKGYWQRFMDNLENALRGVSHQCCETLTKFAGCCAFEERQLHCWRGNAGEIRLYMTPMDMERIDIMDFDDDTLTSYIDEIAGGYYVPVTFRADVYYRNGVRMASFTTDTEVNEPERPGAADYRDVVLQAIVWIREEAEDMMAAAAATTPRLAAPKQQLAA